TDADFDAFDETGIQGTSETVIDRGTQRDPRQHSPALGSDIDPSIPEDTSVLGSLPHASRGPQADGQHLRGRLRQPTIDESIQDALADEDPEVAAEVAMGSGAPPPLLIDVTPLALGVET